MQTPSDLGLPADRFPAWREGQVDAILRAHTGGDEARRFSALVLPTGFGKSLVYVALAMLSGWRTVILTSTKALQAQLARDLNDLIVLVQGQREYTCHAVEQGGPLAREYHGPLPLSVDYGPCHAGHLCSLKPDGCDYYHTVQLAESAPIVVTNYAWWHTIHHYNIAKLRPELLVLDEAHAAPDALAAAVGARLILSECRRFLSERVDTLVGKPADRWVGWARDMSQELGTQVENAKLSRREDGKTIRRMMNLQGELTKLARLDPDLVVITPEDNGDVMLFDALWAQSLAESMLFRGTRRVVLTSATLTRKTTDLLGIVPKRLDFYAAGDGFDRTRRPVYICPATNLVDTAIRVDHRMQRNDQAAWVEHIDRILDDRTDRKGIIHTVSYKRADLFLTQSRHRARMMSHTSRDTRAQVQRFKAARPGTIFVSPSVTTGYDFPGDECEYQIICKVPFPDSRNPITAARIAVDPEYRPHLAMQEMVQMAGRGMRAGADRCETFITDAHASWFFRKHSDLAPAWFMRAVRHVSDLPPVPPRVEITTTTAE